MFAAKSAKKLDKADGEQKDQVQKKKVKQLTVLDPKSAQNMCKYEVFKTCLSQYTY